MSTWRLKPRTVEAVQWREPEEYQEGDELPAGVTAYLASQEGDHWWFAVERTPGWLQDGDWILKDGQHFRRLGDAELRERYEKVG